MAPSARHGDLLPLPLPSASDVSLAGCGSSAAARRSHRGYRIHARSVETVEALNHLAGFTDRRDWPHRPVNQAQASAIARIRALHVARRYVPGPGPEAALQKLLRQGPAYSGAATGALAPYEEDLVSLPSGSEKPCFLRDIIPDVWQAVLDNCEDGMLLAQCERDAIADDSSVAEQFYFDPVLERSAEVCAVFGAALCCRSHRLLQSWPCDHRTLLCEQEKWNDTFHRRR